VAPAPSDVQVSVETITPEQAADYLQLNTSNRPLNARQVEKWAQVLRASEWELNGSSIVLNGTRLIDGQHRLKAVVLTGIPMTTIVVRNVDPKVFDTIDVGRKRTGMDALAVAGYRNTAQLASAARDVWQYQTSSIPRKRTAENRVLLQVLEQHPGLVASHRICERYRCRHITISILTAYHYLFSLVDPEAANKFIYDLAKGTGLEASDPVYMLRERLLASVSKGYTSKQSKIDSIAKRALLIKAFNARFMGRPIKSLRWALAEDFPMIYGLTPDDVLPFAAALAQCS
jgi:hypothetical protein